MVTDLLIVSLCVTACSMAGVAYFKAGRGRVEYFNSCVKLSKALNTEISFKCENIPTALKRFMAFDNSELRRHIEKYLADPFGKIVISGKMLKKEEKNLVAEFFSFLGSSDCATQLNGLKSYEDKFNELYARENAKFAKNGSAGIKLSVLAGLTLGILIL